MYLVATWARLGTIELTVTMTASELGRADEHRCSTYSELLVGLGGDFIGGVLDGAFGFARGAELMTSGHQSVAQSIARTLT